MYLYVCTHIWNIHLFLSLAPPLSPPPPLQVYSLSVPYVASTEIQAQHTNQLSLVKDQPIRVLDGRRDDWWLAQTIPDYEYKTGFQENGMETRQNEILPKEGWVPAALLQPSQGERASVYSTSHKPQEYFVYRDGHGLGSMAHTITVCTYTVYISQMTLCQ